MLKKTITYVDFNGTERKEDFYFNLTTAEVLEMETSIDGGLSSKIEKIVQTRDIPSIIKIFKDLIIASYGEKSPDGKRFVKSFALSIEFTQTEAYSNLFMELSTNAEMAAAFVNGIIPSEKTK